MSRRRLLFLLLFFTGTVLASLGWYAEWRVIVENLNTIIIAGHALQVVGLFGYILIPDALVRIRDHEENYESDYR